MQIRPENDILARYGSPSRPISPSSLSSFPNKKIATTGDEPAAIETQTTEFQPGYGPHPHQQHSPTLPPQFPPELIDHIVDHLHDDKKSLIRCSKVSRVFSHATSYHLFRTVSIPSAQICVEFQELVWSSLHPLSSSPIPHSSSSSTPTASSPSAPPRATNHQTTQAQADLHSTHLHPDRTHAHSHTRHTCTPNCDVPLAGWDISRFVRKIEFFGLDQPIEGYVSEAVKLVRMLPRIHEVSFRWWDKGKATGMEQIGRAFAAIPSNQCNPPNQPSSSASTAAFSETRVGQTPTSDPLKLHLELVGFSSVHKFLDFLGSFGSRLRELSLSQVIFDRARGGGNGKVDIQGRFLPGIECVCLGYDAVVKPRAFDPDGHPTMGTSAIHKPQDVCDILESIAPNVSELQLFGDDAGGILSSLNPGSRTMMTLRLPTFRKLKLVTINALGPLWSDLVYEIAAWFAKHKSGEEIADTACQDGRASASSSSPVLVTPSLPSSTSVTRYDPWKDRKRTRVRFMYPVRKGDVDWKELESAVLGEDVVGATGQGGGSDCSPNGNHGGLGDVGRESDGGRENDQVGEMVMTISQAGNQVAGGSCSARFMAGSLWVEVRSGCAVLGELRRELGRLDRLELLQVSCR